MDFSKSEYHPNAHRTVVWESGDVFLWKTALPFKLFLSLKNLVGRDLLEAKIIYIK